MQSSSAALGRIPKTGSAVPLTRWDRMERYLVLGTDDGVYYTGDSRLSPDRAAALRACLAEDGARVVDRIAEIAGSGRAARPDSALYALAMAASPQYAAPEVNARALEVLPRVAHTASHLKKFAAYVSAHRGWGRSLRSAFARWYLEMPVRELARQMLKHRRGRWAHADLLRMAHPTPGTKAQSALFRWAVDGAIGRTAGDLFTDELKQVHGYEMAKKASSKYEIVELIESYQLTYEMIPDRWLASADVWAALLDGMPYCAMLRNLGRLTAAGLVTPQGEATALVAARLVDHRRIARSRVSPVTVLSTLLSYRDNYEVTAIAAALETVFYASLANVPPVGRRLGIVLDGSAPVASTILAMLAARQESEAMIAPACCSPNDRVDAVLAAVRSARPHLDQFPLVDALVVVLGQSGWIGPPGPEGVPMVLVAPNAREAALPRAPDDTWLQIVGFDSSVPRAIAAFLA